MATDALRGTMKTTRLRKIECDSCGLILRGSRAPILAAGLPSCACGGTFTWADAEDAYACLDGRELSSHPAVVDELARDDRRAARAAGPTGARHVVGMCGGCRKPITRTNEVCGCGFHNDLRRRRNVGGYGGGMPF